MSTITTIDWSDAFVGGSLTGTATDPVPAVDASTTNGTRSSMASNRVAVDIGGTFTDVVGFDVTSQRLVIGKTLSTPGNLIDGIVTGLDSASVALAETESIVHGSTVVINALIERRGARTAVVTTKGFRDVYEIGRVNRPDAFNLGFRKHRPLVPRDLVFEVTERIGPDGAVRTPVDEREIAALAEGLRARGVEAIAVVLLHSYRNPAHEQQVGKRLRALLPDCFVSLSHELSREYREYERTSTTAANAFVGPTVSRYLDRLHTAVVDAGSPAALSIMQSNGGVSDIGTVREQSVQMMESGPAGGVVGTIELCRQLGLRDAIAFDMGGTTAKAAVIRDQTFPMATEYFVGGYARGLPIRIPCLDIVEVGTGGGSLAWVDDGGGMHVGPRSAGASPGPACYGLGGTDATVTDAAVVLGLLSPERGLSGDLRLDVDAATTSVETIGRQLDLTAVQAAGGVLQIAASSMANAVRAVTTERGLDPRDFTLFAFGGNGPLHISLVARELGISSVVIPPVPAVFSALGMLMADVRHDLALTGIRRLSATPAEVLDAEFAELEKAGSDWFSTRGHDGLPISFVRTADMRYVGQEHTLTVVIPDDLGTAGTAALKAEFDRAHLERFSHADAAGDAEVVTLRLSVIGGVPRPEWPTVPTGTAEPEADARIGIRPMVLEPAAGEISCPVYERSRLRAGNRIDGPAAVEEGTTTTLLRVGDTLIVDALGNLLLQIGTRR
jgi:N-methylhydantoinase A